MRRLVPILLITAAACGGRTPPPARPAPRPFSTPMMVPGVRTPAAVPGKSADLDPEAEVVGVVSGGKARAYSLKGLSHIFGHVVNDAVGGKAVTVAYCDLEDCLRAYTLPDAAGPLDLEQAGREDGSGLLLRLDGNIYRQRDGGSVIDGAVEKLSLADLPFVRTTWRKWLADHPDTDVYLGLPPGPRED